MRRLTRLLTAGLGAALVLTWALPTLAQTISILRAETSGPEKDENQAIATAYMAGHPGVQVKFEYLANDAYKQKLPTLLQSDQRPDLFYSWGGGVLLDQAKAGFLQDITASMKGDWANSLSPAGVKAFTIDNVVYGAPINASEVVFWTNTALATKANIDPKAIHTWDDFLAAVQKIKGAGITPIVVGGKDKWPLHFYYGYLALREAGAQGFADAVDDKGDGFAASPFIKAGEDFKRLIDLKPFQDGFMDTTYEQASGLFGDGKAVFQLMGDWDYGSSKQSSVSGKGLPDDGVAIVRFPVVSAGAGAPTDTFGGINGWAVAKSASPAAVDFLKYMTSVKYQSEAGAKGFFIPVAKGAETGITNPFFKQMSQNLAASTFHQVFLDQALGADVGATINDIAADLAQGATTPEDAAKTLKRAWESR